MYKKIVLLIVILIVSLNSYAGGIVSSASFSGFYLGGQLGYAEGYLQNQLFLNWSEGGAFLGVQLFRRDFQTVNITGVGGLQFGYGFQRGKFYLGTEIHAMYLDLEMKSNRSGLTLSPNITGVTNQFSDSQIDSTFQGDFGFALRPGLIISPNALLVGRLGIVVSQLKLDSRTLLESPFGGNATVITEAERVRRIAAPGFRLGLSMEALLSPHWSWNVEYLYTDYGRYHISNNALSPGLAQISSVNELKLKTRGLMVGFSYFFNGKNDYVAPQNDNSYKHFNGFYFGPRFGFLQSYFRIRPGIQAVVAAFPLVAPGSFGSEMGQSDLAGGLFVGVGHNISRLYGALEFFGTIENSAVTSRFESFETVAPQITTVITNASINNEYGFGFKPGVFLTHDVLLYGWVGFATAFIKMSSFTESSAGIVSSSDRVTAGKNAIGMRVGVGMEAKIGSHLGFNISYYYTNYPSLSTSSTIAFVNTPGGIFVNNDRVFPRAETLLVGLSYYIN